MIAPLQSHGITNGTRGGCHFCDKNKKKTLFFASPTDDTHSSEEDPKPGEGAQTPTLAQRRGVSERGKGRKRWHKVREIN